MSLYVDLVGNLMSDGASASEPQSEFRKSVQARHLKRSRKDRRIILAHGDHVQVLRIAPWMGALLVLVLLISGISIVASSSYLFFRDELFTASIKRQHQIQVAYEDRISDLRREIDRITSRQLLNQQAYEARVERLLTEHIQLYEQGARLNTILDQAGSLGLVPRPAPPSPIAPPNQEARAQPRLQLGTMADQDMAFLPIPSDALITGSLPQLPTHRRLTAMEQAVVDPAGLLGALDETVEAREHNQIVALAALAVDADQETDAIVEAISSLGVRVTLPEAPLSEIASAPSSVDGVGGPLLEPRGEADQFELYVLDAQRAMINLRTAREAIDLVPVAAPTRGARLSSRFGNRRDPFTRRTAFHSGIDYAAPRGTPVYAPADGVVTRAGRRGGYGLMIELDHAHGLSTRFAHLSRMLVAPGAQVRRGDVIARIGSTGRSTGPHLHYEVRRGTRAVDPLPFVRAGQHIDDL